MTKSGIIAEIINEVAGMQKQSITDAVALELHLRHITAAGQLPASVRGRRGVILRLADYLDPYAENPRAVIEATSDQLAEWQASKSHLSAKSINVYVHHTQAYYEWLRRPMRIIAESPAADLVPPPVRRKQPRPIPEEDLEYALDACTDQRLQAWLILGSYAGLRTIDISNLDRDCLTTEHQVPMLLVRGKGGHEDLIPVGDEVMTALAPFLGTRGPMFVNSAGRRFPPKRIGEAVNAYLRRIGLPYTAHQLRHRYGTKIYTLTKDLRYTQRLMRHRSVTSTEIYVAAPTEADVSVMRVLDTELAKRPRLRSVRRDRSA